jgi:hypothetical protein
MSAVNAPGRMTYFLMLTQDEQAHAIRRLADSGMTVHGIAAAAGVSVQQIRSILGQRQQCGNCDE